MFLLLFFFFFFQKIQIFKTLGFTKKEEETFPFIVSLNIFSLFLLSMYWHFYTRVNQRQEEIISWLKLNRLIVNDFNESWTDGDLICKFLYTGDPKNFSSVAPEKIENITPQERFERSFMLVEENFEVQAPFESEKFIKDPKLYEQDLKNYLNFVHKILKSNVLTLILKTFLEQTYKLALVGIFFTSLIESGTGNIFIYLIIYFDFTFFFLSSN